jgi:hypothetical protein
MNTPIGDLQAQMVGAMAKAEKEASQKLLSVLPYQTGQVTRRPPETLQGRRTLDRHSFAIGDTEEYNRLFTNPLGTDFLSPHPSTFGNTSASLLDDQSLLSRAHLKSSSNDKSTHAGSPLFGARPRSVVESGDLSSTLLGNEWSYGNRPRTANNNVGHIGDRSMNGRPKSADVTNWYNSDIPPPIGDKGLSDRGRPFSSNSPWNLTPSVSSFTERDAGIERPSSVSDVDLQNALASWSLANNLGYPRANVMMNDDSKGFRRRPMTRGIPRTVPESDEQTNNNAFYSTFVENEREKGSQPPPGSGGSTLSGSGSQSLSVSRSGSPAPTASNSTGHFGNSSFGMWSGKHLSVPGLDKQAQQQQHAYGQFLNPNDANFDGGDLDYVSDHSDTSVISSNGTRRRRTSATGNSRAIKDKKAAEVVDMELLQGEQT